MDGVVESQRSRKKVERWGRETPMHMGASRRSRKIPGKFREALAFWEIFCFYSLDLSQAAPSALPPSALFLTSLQSAMAKSSEKKADKKADKKTAKTAAAKEATPAKTKPISSKEILAKANVRCLQ